jgi:hypothetical protein
MQGYVAREGLGITRTRNQIVEIIPITKNNTFGGILWSSIHFLISAGLNFMAVIKIEI